MWFNQPWIARELGEGTHVLLHGKLRQRNQFWVKNHELLGNGNAPVHTLGRVPVHPATKGITPDRLRALVSEARPLARAAVEPLPARLRVEEGLPERPAVLDAVHFPESEDDEQEARRRLAFEELFLLQLAVAGRRRARREGRKARPLAARGVVVDRWRWSLPFELTGDQASAMAEIDADLARERPMQRLLMGEVGSGKTAVALARHAPRRRERRPGRAHGAHGDARRAAPPHARLAARRAHAGGAAHRLHDRRAAARAARPARERSSFSSWSARTR